MGADVTRILRCWEDLKLRRLPREGEWQQICDYFMPRKDFTATQPTGALRRRRIVTGTPVVALKRSAALVTSYMVDTSRPFIRPNVARGLALAGRRNDLSDQDRDYLETVEWTMFDRMMLPQGQFLSSASRTVLELVGFGTGILFTGRKRGFGPRYMARPLRACWIGVNADGDVDTLYFGWRLPAWRVIERFPEADKIDKIRELAADEKRCNQLVELLSVVEPRRDGEYGAAAERKPYAEVTLAWQHKAVLEETGYDSFPFSIPRLNLEEGSDYGTGLAWDALPDAAALNVLEAAMERGVELSVEPPWIYAERMFSTPVDRRPGAGTPVDLAGLGFMNLRDSIQKMDVSGDVSVGDAYLQRLQQNIDRAFYVDWMNLRENGNVTAEEIRERRDLRLKAMSSLIPSIDRDLIGRCGDRSLEILVAEGMLPRPPTDLAGVEVDWDYAGPLALAQQQGQADAILRLITAAQQVASIDQSATAILALEEGLRALAEAWGAPQGAIRSRQYVDDYRAKEAKDAEEARNAQNAATAAGAVRDVGQGTASLAQTNLNQSSAEPVPVAQAA